MITFLVNGLGLSIRDNYQFNSSAFAKIHHCEGWVTIPLIIDFCFQGHSRPHPKYWHTSSKGITKLKWFTNDAYDGACHKWRIASSCWTWTPNLILAGLFERTTATMLTRDEWDMILPKPRCESVHYARWLKTKNHAVMAPTQTPIDGGTLA